MSYIDTFSHSEVGSLFGLPLYHPLVTLGDEGCFANSKDLILGGGSGEHPIMRINNLSYCVGLFLVEFGRYSPHLYESKYGDFLKQYQELTEKHTNYLGENDLHPYDILEYNWNIRSVANFYTEVLNSYKNLSSQWSLKDEHSGEYLTCLAIGEIVFYGGKRLLPDELSELLTITAFNHTGHSVSLYDTVYPLFNLLKVPVPGSRYGGCLYARHPETKQIWQRSTDVSFYKEKETLALIPKDYLLFQPTEK